MSRRHINMGAPVERAKLSQFNQMFINPVCWPTLSFAPAGLPWYSGPSNGWKKVRAYPKIAQSFDLSGFDENQVELALSEIGAQVKAAGFERGSYRGRPDNRYHDGLGLHMTFSCLRGHSSILIQLFASSSAEGALGEGVFGVRRGWLETPKHSLRALVRNPMSKPRLPVGQLSYRTDLVGVRYNRYVRKPSRVWSFYKFEEDQQTRVLEELLNQADDAGYEMADMLGHETLPLAQFRGKRTSGLRRQRHMLTITASQQNVGVELRSC